MDRLTLPELRRLAAHEADVCVSIGMPLFKTRPDVQQNPIRLRNLLDQAESKLLEEGRRSSAVRDLLQPARELLTNGTFWRANEAEGLFVLVSEGLFRTLYLPEKLKEDVMIGRRFLLEPLVRFCRGEEEFFLLALSGGAVRLYLCRDENMQPVALPPGCPTDMETALAGTELEKSLQAHVSVPHRSGGRGDLIMHGHGTPKDDTKTLITEYFQIVCKHLEPKLREELRPLMLAAVDYCHPIFRQICKYPQLMEQGVSGSPDELSEQELFQRAREAAQPFLTQGRTLALERCREFLGTDRVADELEQILFDAHQGRVDTLLVAGGARVWGRYDFAQTAAIRHETPEPGDEDLVNLAIAVTLTHGGRSYVYPSEELPRPVPALALRRW